MEELVLYPSHTIMFWKGTTVATYIKCGSSGCEWWVSLLWDTDKDMFKLDKDKKEFDFNKPNRFAVKQTDEGMRKNFDSTMDFKKP